MKHTVDQGGLAVVDVGYNSNITNVLHKICIFKTSCKDTKKVYIIHKNTARIGLTVPIRAVDIANTKGLPLGVIRPCLTGYRMFVGYFRASTIFKFLVDASGIRTLTVQ